LNWKRCLETKLHPYRQKLGRKSLEKAAESQGRVRRAHTSMVSAAAPRAIPHNSHQTTRVLPFVAVAWTWLVMNDSALPASVQFWNFCVAAVIAMMLR
jgi:hypothetical protein